MNIRSENKNKQFSGFPKIVAIICIAIAAILAVGAINNRNKEQQRENAINEMQMQIDKDYDICTEMLEVAKADDYSKKMIDILITQFLQDFTQIKINFLIVLEVKFYLSQKKGNYPIKITQYIVILILKEK